MPPKSFLKGDKVEVRRRNDAVIWHPATILHSAADKMHVLYETLTVEGDPTSSLLAETVGVENVRPNPPVEPRRHFKIGEEVEAFCSMKKGWRMGTVVEILENSMYAVMLEGEGGKSNQSSELLEEWRLRGFKEWSGGEWISKFSPQETVLEDSPESEVTAGKSQNSPDLELKSSGKLQNSPESEVKSSSIKLKIKLNQRPSKESFHEGMLVEVTSDEEGFRGSWYTASVIGPVGNDKFSVQYKTLSTEDKTELLKEEAHFSCIRHSPPIVRRIGPFSYLDRVEAWFNDGWWEGYIVKVMDISNYMIHFTHTHEEMVFEHCKLRPRQDLIDGKWLTAPKIELLKEDVKPKLKRKYSKNAYVPTFKDGMMVEVKSDEEGYQGSWYCAMIVGALDCDNYLVEFLTLKTDDGAGPLREKTLSSNIRPYPPNLVRIDRYTQLEEVDAWYNDGWWVGLISKVLDGAKYAVYFWTTNEAIVFDHVSLRPHQEWTAGKWIVAFKKKSRQTQGHNDRKVVGEPYFPNGMKVEVKSDEVGYKGSWYAASIVQPIGSQKYMIQYQTLNTENGSEQLKEEALAPCIRPVPPFVEAPEEYKPLEAVDAWYNDGWWVGQIYKILEDKKYTVYFCPNNEVMVFQHSDLRPHHDWVNGKWLLAERGKRLWSSLS